MEVFEHAEQAGDQGDDEQHRQDENDDGEQHPDAGAADGGLGPQAAAGGETAGQAGETT